MRRDELALGPVPSDEPCEQLGVGYQPERAREECRRYIAQLRRQFGPEPEGARLKISSNPHDFGNYLEVTCVFDDSLPGAVDYAFACESEAWPEWREEEK